MDGKINMAYDIKVRLFVFLWTINSDYYVRRFFRNHLNSVIFWKCLSIPVSNQFNKLMHLDTFYVHIYGYMYAQNTYIWNAKNEVITTQSTVLTS